MSEHADAADEAVEAKLINEEYKIWKKNAVFLYDMIFRYGAARRRRRRRRRRKRNAANAGAVARSNGPRSRRSGCPTSRSKRCAGGEVQGADAGSVPGSSMVQHRLLLGTHTSNQGPNYVQIATANVPEFKEPSLADADADAGDVGSHGSARQTFQFGIVQQINHDGEVNKARYQPQNPNLIATRCNDGRVLVFDRTKHESKPRPDGVCKPELELCGHTREGFALSWCATDQGRIATGGEDAKVMVWSVRDGFRTGARTLDPMCTYSHHSSIVNDVQFHPSMGNVVGSASDDLSWQMVDTRQYPQGAALANKRAHSDAINCLAFHPQHEWMLATGSADRTIGLWDMRNASKKMHAYQNHSDSVVGVQFHPTDAAILASSSYDRRICVWDASRIGEEQTHDDAEEGPPELYVSAHARRPRTALTGAGSSCTAASPIASATLTGTRMTRGSWSPPPRTTSCRCSGPRAASSSPSSTSLAGRTRPPQMRDGGAASQCGIRGRCWRPRPRHAGILGRRLCASVDQESCMARAFPPPSAPMWCLCFGDAAPTVSGPSRPGGVSVKRVWPADSVHVLNPDAYETHVRLGSRSGPPPWGQWRVWSSPVHAPPSHAGLVLPVWSCFA